MCCRQFSRKFGLNVRQVWVSPYYLTRKKTEIWIWDFVGDRLGSELELRLTIGLRLTQFSDDALFFTQYFSNGAFSGYRFVNDAEWPALVRQSGFRNNKELIKGSLTSERSEIPHRYMTRTLIARVTGRSK
jgi:hypothetical protein